MRIYKEETHLFINNLENIYNYLLTYSYNYAILETTRNILPPVTTTEAPAAADPSDGGGREKADRRRTKEGRKSKCRLTAKD